MDIYEIYLYFSILANEYNQQFSPKRQFTIRHQEEEDDGYSGQCLKIPGEEFLKYLNKLF